MKSIITLITVHCYILYTVHYYIVDCVSWVPRLTTNKLDFRMSSWNGTNPHVGDLTYFTLEPRCLS